MVPRKKPMMIGTKAPFPGFIEPALATSIDKVPDGERWLHEIKFDGYRVPVHLANEMVQVYTRRGNDWTKRPYARRIAQTRHGGSQTCSPNRVPREIRRGQGAASFLQGSARGLVTQCY
jgi:ATP-dependent DNA ligase